MEYNEPVETLKTRLENELKNALRAKDEVKKRTVRMAIAAIRFSEIEGGKPLEDDSILSILQKEIKNRQEAIEEAKRANRDDLIADNEAEIKVLEEYLPRKLTHDELVALVKSVITEVDAKSPADMKRVMPVLLPRVQGRAPGAQVSQVVRELLQQG